MEGLLPKGQLWRQSWAASHVSRAQLPAAGPDAPGMGFVRTVHIAPKGLWVCGILRSLLVSGKVSGSTHFWGQGFWAGGPRQRLRTLTEE